MAFPSPLCLPNAAAVTTDLWPSVANALATPWKRFSLPSSEISPGKECNEVHRRRRDESPTSVPMTALRNGSKTNTLFGQHTLSPIFYSRTLKPTALIPFYLTNNPVLATRTTIWTSRFSSAPNIVKSSSPRQFSTISLLQLDRSQSIPKVKGIPQIQQHRFLYGGPFQNVLAHTERTANSKPHSVSAQNAFYSALLRANMPAIIIERYRSGKYAGDGFSEATYLKALERVGGLDASVGLRPVQNQFQSQNQNLNNDQLQAVGQAVAAHMNGAQIGLSTKKDGTGAKESPLYVVVEESLSSSIYRWVKFIFIFLLFTYVSFVVINIIADTTGILKNVRGSQPNEAQPQHQQVRFSDVHGCDEAKEELQELVEFLTNPERFNNLGGKLPKGVLLVGPPGTGKTLLARAVAGEAGVPFFYMSGSEFDEVYVGVGAKRVRELFNQARTKAPAIIFIDELDAIGAKRNERDAAYVKQTLNQLLTELDGFSQSTGVIIIAATNYPKLLDKALTRPGRFDRRVVVGLPDVRGRVDILKHHMKNVQISTDVDTTVIARGTPGFSGADLENLVNQAAIHASKNKQTKVGPKDFDWAKDKIMMGAEARSRVMREKDKLLTAYHEAGHALVAYFSPAATPLYKITIVPRGMSLGTTHFLPEMDIVSRNYTEFLADIDVSMGGKAAEELVFGPENVTSGISSDLQRATNTAFSMVTQYGYSKKLGSIDLISNYKSLSSETKQEIEAEVRRLVEESSRRATAILTEHRKELELLTKALMEYETLTKDEMEKVLRGEKLDKLESIPKAPIILPDALMAAGLKPPAGESAAPK
ncbi:intermembrane space AAA protease IAP-1 [Histoplasma capsulatum H143]|uniref:Intermembrane space AAA protease IAP-1 n=1 Tax=Ajellomyces capsulatus (strain H143) TaxID=544712 RepID=C6HIZ9_AJECH|nr:intermembrane space AAA protease IAP-1 [Histoplasma capsulatum H143]